MKLLKVTLVLAAAALLFAQADSALQKAIRKETLEGDLKGAIDQYKKLVQGKDRAVAAQALVRMGQCYEKLGDAEARKAYEHAVRDFGDQKDLAETARARLAAMASSAKSSGISVRRVFEGLPGDPSAVSPDGRLVLHYENRTTSNHVVRDLATGQSRQVTSYDKSSGYLQYDPMFSPDSRRIAYTSWPKEDQELHVVGVDGAGDRIIWKTDEYFELKGWFPDGSRLVTLIWPKAGPKRLLSVSLADGAAKVLKEGDATLISGGWLSQEGKYFAFLKQRGPDPLQRDIWCLSLENSSETPLVVYPANNRSPLWTPDGKGILFDSDRRGTSGLWYLPVSAGKPAGVPELIKGDVGETFWPIGLTHDGTLYYETKVTMTDSFMAEFDPATGKIVSAPLEIAPKLSGHTQNAAFSTDGQWLAYCRRSAYVAKRPTLILRSLTTGEEREMATDFRDVHAQRWFPDGRSLLVYATNGPGYYRFDIATGRSNLLTRCRITFHTLSRDGKTLYLVRRRQTGTPYALCSRNLETGEEHELLQNDNVSIYPAISPDGRHLAITRIQGDDSLIEILPLGGGNRREIFRVRAAEALLGFPAWSPDGREILFSRRTPKGERVELWRIPAQGGAPAKTDFSVQQVREQGQDWDSGIIVPAKTDFSVQQLRGLTFHPDGRRFVFDAGFDRTEFWAMENFLPKASK